MDPLTRIDQALADARRARASHRPDACLAALRRARLTALDLDDPDHPLLHLTCWRLAKAEHDFGDLRRALHALRPSLEAPSPLRHYPQALSAAEPLTARTWRTLGYGESEILAIWHATAEHHASSGDPYLAAMAEVRAAWQEACAGQLEPLSEGLERWARATPETFGSGPHRHPHAPDTPSSVFYVQMDIARTALRGATWMGEERLAWEAAELYEDAIEESGQRRASSFWFLEPVVRAALQFGWDGPRRSYVETYQSALNTLDHPRGVLHRALGAGWLARHEGDASAAVFAFLEAAEAARSLEAGAEWEVDALLEAHRSGADTQSQALDLARRFGVGVRR